jgi:hypothetical protein
MWMRRVDKTVRLDPCHGFLFWRVNQLICRRASSLAQFCASKLAAYTLHSQGKRPCDPCAERFAAVATVPKVTAPVIEVEIARNLASVSRF